MAVRGEEIKLVWEDGDVAGINSVAEVETSWCPGAAGSRSNDDGLNERRAVLA